MREAQTYTYKCNRTKINLLFGDVVERYVIMYMDIRL